MAGGGVTRACPPFNAAIVLAPRSSLPARAAVSRETQGEGEEARLVSLTALSQLLAEFWLQLVCGAM